MIGLNWEEYKDDVLELIFEIGKLVDHILISSPNDFNEGVKILKRIKNS
jgi:hypothetical protein